MTDRGDASETEEVLRAWRDALLADLAADDAGLADAGVDIDGVLGLAGVVAHGVVRPAAPLTAYIVGIAVGRAIAAGSDPETAFEAAASRARTLAAEFRPSGS